LLLDLGISRIAERIGELTDHLCERVAQAGFEVYSSRRPQDKSGIVSLVVPEGNVRPYVRRCKEEGLVINQRAGRLRVSPHCYNTMDELDRLVNVLTTIRDTHS
jgi:selenocysteine lyase/cysteine desulfurase